MNTVSLPKYFHFNIKKGKTFIILEPLKVVKNSKTQKRLIVQLFFSYTSNQDILAKQALG